VTSPPSDEPPIGTRSPLVVINPRASHLHDERRRQALRVGLEQALIARYGMTPDWAGESHAEARAALRDIVGRPLVVAAGGDGTVREAAEALAGTPTPLAIVPAGTGNVLAGSLRIRGARRAIELIAHAGPRTIDLGLARWGTPDGDEHHRHFTVACGTGFDARLMAAAEHEWKRRLRFGAYIGAAVREAARLTPARFRIQADGADIDLVGLLVLIVNTGDLIPGRVGPRQPMDPADGRLDLLVVGGRDLLAGVRGAADLLLRTGEQDGSVVRRAVRSVRVDSDPPQPVQTDGDAHAPGWLEARVLPGALRVLAPGRGIGAGGPRGGRGLSAVARTVL
jgi:diacylglycerol kinase family enzyme